MTADKIESFLNQTEDDVAFVTKLSDEMVCDKTSDLDELMRAIRQDVVCNDNASDFTLERYLLELTNSMYFINSNCEKFGFYEDITKTNARLRYNQLYSENQIKNSMEGKKTTNADNQLYAEINSVDESVLSMVYARTVKIIKGKLESANEMIRTLSKILSVHMNDSALTKFSRQIGE